MNLKDMLAELEDAQLVRRVARHLTTHNSDAGRDAERENWRDTEHEDGRDDAGLELEYIFKHVLVQETAYSSLLKTRRVRLHWRVAAVLEAMHPNDFEALAYHYREAGDDARARTYFVAAGERALRVYANAEAEGHFRTALSLGGSAQERAQWLTNLGEAQARQSCFKEAIASWEQAIAVYHKLGDSDSEAGLYARASRAAWYGGDTPHALRIALMGLTETADAPETKAIAALRHEAARSYYLNGQPQIAHPLARQALALAERLGDVETQAETLITIGQLPDQTTDAKFDALVTAVELAVRGKLTSTANRAHYVVGLLLQTAYGELVAAREQYQQSADLARQMGSASRELIALNEMARVSLLLGDFAEVEAMLPNLRQLASASEGSSPGTLGLLVVEARLHFYRGEWSEAEQLFRASRDEANHRDDLHQLGVADSWLAQVHMERGEWNQAATYLAECIELGDRGLGVLESSPRYLLARVRAYQGRFEEARRLIDEACAKAGLDPELANQRRHHFAEGTLAAAERRWSDAIASFEAVADIENRTGLCWHRARTLQVWAEAYLARNEAGDASRARDLLQQALTEFEKMGARRYAEQVRARLNRQ